MRLITALAIILASASAHASFIGKTVKDVEAAYGEPSDINEFIKGWRYYTFTNETTSMEFRPINGKILKIEFKYAGNDREKFLSENIGNFDQGWTTQAVSQAELSIFQFAQPSPDCTKLRNNDIAQTVYIGPDPAEPHTLRAEVVSDEFLKTEAADKDNGPRCQLNYGYLAGLNSTLHSFFEDWHKKVNPCKHAKLDYPEIVEKTYEVFECFYLPDNFNRIAPETTLVEPESLPEFYYVLAGNISVNQYARKFPWQKEKEPVLRLIINDFRPNIKIGGAKIVILTDEYKWILEEFLGDEQYDLGHGSIMAPAQARDESLKRQQYINQVTKVMHGHWGGWHLTTHPEVYQIDFNNSLSSATAHYRVGYSGGEAMFKLENNNWVMESFKLTWIE